MPSPSHEQQQARRRPPAVGVRAPARPEAVAAPATGGADAPAALRRECRGRRAHPATDPAPEPGAHQRRGSSSATTRRTQRAGRARTSTPRAPAGTRRRRRSGGRASSGFPCRDSRTGTSRRSSRGRKAVPPDPANAGDRGKKAIVSDEREKTTESAKGRAIVLLPKTLMQPRPGREVVPRDRDASPARARLQGRPAVAPAGGRRRRRTRSATSTSTRSRRRWPRRRRPTPALRRRS